LPKFDLTRYNQVYFDRLRSRVQKLNDAGIYVGVYTFTAEWIGRYRCSTDGYPFTGSNNVNGINDGGAQQSLTMTAPNAITAIQDAYVEKVIDTLNDLPNVLWIVSEEAPTNSTWWNNHQIAHIRAYEAGKPYQHPIGYGTLADLGDAVVTNSDADWIAPGSRESATTSCGAGAPRCKVNINDSDHSYFGLWNSSVQSHRNFAWQNFMTGNQAAFMDPYVLSYTRENRNACAAPTQGICAQPHARYDNFRDNFGYIVRYSRRLNMAAVMPRGSLCSTGYCLAQTPASGAEYLVYAPNGGSFTVNLSAMPSSRMLNVEWLNPSTGVTSTANPIPAGSSSRSFTPPFQGDAVLYLVDASGHAQATPSTPAPGTSATSYVVRDLAPGTYRFRIRAADAAGNVSPYSDIVTASIESPADTTPPTAPGNLTASVQSASEIRLTWAAATDNVGLIGYRLSRCQNAACTSFAQVDGLVTSTSYLDGGLSPWTSYTYRVVAIDAANNQGAPSNTATATTLPLAGSAVIALVQHTSRDAGSATSSTLAFPSPNIAGNWIGVAVRSWPAAQRVTISDSRGNTYRRAVQMNETSDGMVLALYYAENVGGGANTVTVAQSQSGGTMRFAIFEYSGVARTDSLDVARAAQGTNSSPSSGIVTTTSPGSLVIGLVSTANARTLTASSGFAIQERVPTSNSKLFVQDLRPAPAGLVSAGGVLNGSDAWAAVVAAFRAVPPQ
jgi:hypothetical protein